MGLADLIGPAGAGLTLRQGEVTQVSPLLVQVGAATTATAARALGSYAPAVGDIVSLLEQDADRLVLGATGTTVWTAPTLTNSWVNFGAGFIASGYRKVGDEVQLRGLIKDGTLNALAFTLPTGFRPSGSLVFASAANGAFASVLIHADGTVVVYAGSNAWLSLNCSFSVS